MKFNKQLLSLLLLVSHQITNSAAKPENSNNELNSFSNSTKEFRLAVIGDSGVSSNAKKVMQLSNYNVLLHLGDYDYNKTPTNYLKEMLEPNHTYSFMGIIGDNDTEPVCTYEEHYKFRDGLYNEMKKNDCVFSSSKCMWSCKYENMRVIGLTLDIVNCDDRSEQLQFLKQNLQDAKEDWKICAWHFYDKYYHTGNYQEHDYNIISSDGENFYDYCKDHGAIIFSAHNSVYARTHVMSKFAYPEIDKYDKDSDGKIVQIRNGATLNILNGVGGEKMDIEQGKQMNYEHWQKKYAKGKGNENEKAFGALFCDFNVEGNNKKASCEFQRINSENKIYDSFTIYRNDNPDTVKYTQIDDAYREERKKAQKIGNNDANSNPVSNVITNKGINDKDKPKSSKPGNKSSKTGFIIGILLVAALAIIGGGFFIYKKKNVDDKLIEMKSPYGKSEGSSFSFTKLPENGKNNTNNSPLKRHGTIDSTFAPLPTGNNFYENKTNYDGYEKSDKKSNDYSEYSYYDVKGTKSSTVDVEPLVSPQKGLNGYFYNDGGRNPATKYSQDSNYRDNNYYSKSNIYSKKEEDDGPRVGASRYRISQKHEPTNKPNKEIKSILKNRDYVPYGTLPKPKDADTSTSTTSRDRSFDPLIKDFNAQSRNFEPSPRVKYDNSSSPKFDLEYYKYR